MTAIDFVEKYKGQIVSVRSAEPGRVMGVFNHDLVIINGRTNTICWRHNHWDLNTDKAAGPKWYVSPSPEDRYYAYRVEDLTPRESIDETLLKRRKLFAEEFAGKQVKTRDNAGILAGYDLHSDWLYLIVDGGKRGSKAFESVGSRVTIYPEVVERYFSVRFNEVSLVLEPGFNPDGYCLKASPKGFVCSLLPGHLGSHAAYLGHTGLVNDKVDEWPLVEQAPIESYPVSDVQFILDYLADLQLGYDTLAVQRQCTALVRTLRNTSVKTADKADITYRFLAGLDMRRQPPACVLQRKLVMAKLWKYNTNPRISK